MRAFVFISAAALMAACSPEAPKADAPVTEAHAPALELQALVMPDDTAGRLGGELSCGFRAGEDLLLLASGIVASQEPSGALVKRGGAVATLTSAEPGYDAMVDGEIFSGEGLTVEVRPTARNETGTEEVAHNATLTARSDSAEHVYEGVWTCGP